MKIPMRFWTTILFVLLAGTCAHAANAKHRDETAELMKLGMEQRCNGQATGIAMREHKLHAPDEIVAYAFADDRIHDTFVEAPGAAIRDGGHWFHLSYKCQTTSDGLGIVSFEYKVGPMIPKDEWPAHQLMD